MAANPKRPSRPARKESWRDVLRTEHAILDLLGWANTMPTLSSVELAQRLPIDIAPISLRQALLKDAHSSRSFPAFARSWLVRLLHEGADASWWTTLFDPDKRSVARQIWDLVESERTANPQWLPASGDDALLVRIFEPFDLHRAARTARVEEAFDRIDSLQFESTADLISRVGPELPLGFTYLAAMRRLDAEVRNGGFAQLYGNGGAVVVAAAIEGFSAAGSKAAEIGRKAQQVEADSGRGSWSQVDRLYYALDPSIFDLAASLLENRPELFEQPAFQLKHDDGRLWRVRVSGANLELEIVIPGEQPIVRKRRCESTAAARREAESLVAEQRREGFHPVVGTTPLP